MKTTVFLLITAAFSTGFFITRHASQKSKVTKHDSICHVYITIDDGPSSGTTFINEIVTTYGIPITVFPIGKNVYKNDSSINLFHLYTKNPLIETGNHSFTHANGHYHQYYSHPEDVMNDFDLNADTCYITSKIARLPGRNTWRINGRKRTDLADDTASADLLAAGGYAVFGWDIEWRCDSNSTTRVGGNDMLQIVRKISLQKNTFTPGNVVILFHDSCFADSLYRLQFNLFMKGLKHDENFVPGKLSSYP
ncbi:MAG: polysaccharide deacetylase family protein [Bacteroidetes bacterium]|nr:polysaccharide deacetylase family protein [Bacteroidota bacterium]